jgi:hypothetical protein
VRQTFSLALFLASPPEVKNIAAKIAMIAITTNNSINVKPEYPRSQLRAPCLKNFSDEIFITELRFLEWFYRQPNPSHRSCKLQKGANAP